MFWISRVPSCTETPRLLIISPFDYYDAVHCPDLFYHRATCVQSFENPVWKIILASECETNQAEVSIVLSTEQYSNVYRHVSIISFVPNARIVVLMPIPIVINHI